MAGETRQVATYKLGDTIRVELDVSDESGVSEVSANFVHVDDVTRKLTLNANGNGERNVTIVLEKRVTNDLAPGKYSCNYISLIDTRGNKNLITKPSIEFRIEGIPGDHEGPKLDRWRVT